MGEFAVDIPALKGASAALVDVRTRLAAVECAPRLASLMGAMPGSAVAGQAVTAADDVLFFQRKTAGDLETMAGAIAASANSYGHSDARSAQRQPTVTPGTAQRLNGGPR